MTKNQIIEQEVAETLKLLDKADQISCSPYFEARLLAKIDAVQKREKPTLGRYLFRPALIPVFFAFIILVNITSVLWVFNENDIDTYDRASYLTAFAEEYSLNQNYMDVFTVNQWD